MRDAGLGGRHVKFSAALDAAQALVVQFVGQAEAGASHPAASPARVASNFEGELWLCESGRSASRSFSFQTNLGGGV